MDSVNLGRVSLSPKGEYSPDVSYEFLDLISYQGSAYIVLKNVIGITPEDGNDYMLLVSKGDKGEQGQRGEKGDTGNGLTILGYYNTFDLLQQDHPTAAPGDSYGVGTSHPYDIYVWDGVNNAWINNGILQGEKGDIGENGATFIPNVTGDGDLTWTNDKGLPNPEAVNIKGERGETGESGQPGISAGFGQVTATIDDTIGNPDVIVETSGDNTAKNFSFLFSGLKGEKGDPGTNEIDESTITSFSGIIKGNGANLTQALVNEDYAQPVQDGVYTLTTEWEGEYSPYTQDVTVQGMTAEKKISVGLASSVNYDQYRIAAKSVLLCTGQEMDKITITAFVEKPSISIPILIRIEG